MLKGSIKADVYGDKEMVKFMLRNLMHNALKFAPSDGLVEIEIKEFQAYVEWKITDNGQGMSKEQIQKVFDKDLNRLNTSSKSGSGIGLFLTNYFAGENKSELIVKSQLGKGTTIILNLPRSK